MGQDSWHRVIQAPRKVTANAMTAPTRTEIISIRVRETPGSARLTNTNVRLVLKKTKKA